MGEFKASYIISKAELAYLLHGVDSDSAKDSLIQKGFAKKVGERFLVEPVVMFLVETLSGSDHKYVIRNEALQADVICSDGICLLVTKYPFIDEAFKFTPYKSLEDLKDDLDINFPLEVMKSGEDLC